MHSLTGALTNAEAPPARQIAIQAIRPNPFQPRQTMDPEALAALAESIRRSGILQPIVVRQRGGHFELVVGHRRWQAARQAGLAQLPAMLREASDEEMLELALIENIHREDLNAMDRAAAYQQYRQRFGLTAEQIAERAGEDRSTVSNYLRLLDLPEAVRQMLRDGALGMGQARALLGISDPLEQTRFATRIIRDALSVRQVEHLVQQQRRGVKPEETRQKRPLIQELEQRFAQVLGTKISILEGRGKNSGRIVIHYRNLADFDRVAERLGWRMEEA
jgi:ParB family chromosome partitioning protein